jgi:hypothetical protein
MESATCARDLTVTVWGAREGDGDRYPGWHEAAEGLRWSGIGEGRQRQSELDERVLDVWR